MAIKKKDDDENQHIHEHDHPDRLPDILDIRESLNKLALVVSSHAMALKIIGVGVGLIVTAILGVSFEWFLNKILHD